MLPEIDYNILSYFKLHELSRHNFSNKYELSDRFLWEKTCAKSGSRVE